MGYERWVFSLSYILILLVGITIAQTEFLEDYCLDTGNYTSNSMYQTNLNTAISSLSSFTNINYGFYNFSVGQNSNRVNVIGLCRGDVEPRSCRSCLNQSSYNLIELCPNQKEAIGWVDDCMIRYSDRSIFGTNETLPNAYLYNLKNTSNPAQFNQVVRSLLDSLRGEAAGGGSTLKFATGNMSGPDDLTIYGLVQCTPDLSTAQCSDCLDGAFDVLPECCNGRIGGRVLRPSCNFRYEIGDFYGQTTIAPPPANGPTPTIALPTANGPPPTANAAPPLGKGGKNKLALISVPTLMAALTAILVV